MADIAFFFHWPKAELEAMDLADLLRWQHLAVDCWNRTNRTE